MKYKLLSVSKCKSLNEVNIGDYVQALASEQFLPHLDGFLDRDEDLADYEGEPCAMIMNGWYMHNPKNWPPSEKIVPLFVAFHLNVLAKEQLISEASIAYFKKHEPIGCRDINTMNILKANGVEAYFSGCMTLTLGMNYKSDIKDEKTFIVDPSYNVGIGFTRLLKGMQVGISHFKDVFKLYRNPNLTFHSGRNFVKEFVKTALYYEEYSRVFGREMVVNSIYVHQQSKAYMENFQTDYDRLKEAERLIKEYAKARLVVTSRIHCALPCLGLGTPVVFVDRKDAIEADSCRMNGLLDLFNIVTFDRGKLNAEFEVELPITASNAPANKGSWKPLADRLITNCKEFMLKAGITPPHQ